MTTAFIDPIHGAALTAGLWVFGTLDVPVAGSER